MADEAFANRRLADLYDVLDGDRNDLDVYLSIASELAATTVLDVGCGTGTFALLLADNGFEVLGVDPDRPSVEVARRKPGAERVTWIEGDATRLPPHEGDLVTMTANVAQAIADESDWHTTLEAARVALRRRDGHLVFETRDPARRAWEGWTREESHQVFDVPGLGVLERWFDLLRVDGPLVTFRGTFVFPDGDVLTSDSTLRFRERDEVERDLVAHGFAVEDVRDAPDRPGRELVFIARQAG
jgi:SAM-dependent methyltransferase